ncbi:MAG: AAA family ATPase [Bacteroidota bacterium]|nr:AAA family ATPase [Bacteroidota bacterium]
MKRQIEDYLKQWKSNKNRKPLIIRGARQVGKTYTITKFGEKHFKQYLKINLEENENLKSFFKDKNPRNIINELSVFFNKPIIPGKSLLFIDEIQLSQDAITVLRYFHEQMPDLHIIAAGSLLDHTLNEMQYSMPVGRVEFAYMYPLNFKEFLLALGEKVLIDYIESFSLNNQFSKLIHSKITDYLRLYFFIGGMPEAIKTYINTQNLIEVEKIHSSIITSLQYDFAKYGTRKQQDYLKDTLQYSANNIGRKVKYVNINKNVHSSHLKEALHKLELSRIIHLVRKTKSANVPITQYVDNDTFKPVFIDIGLANHIAQIKLTDIKNLITDFEGALAEQFVGQEFIASLQFFKQGKLYYWIREAKNSNAEIDYLIQKENTIYPVEVKAGKTGTLKSMHVFFVEKNKDIGIRFNLDLPNYGENLTASIRFKNNNKELKYKLISLPLYFAGNIQNIKI